MKNCALLYHQYYQDTKIPDLSALDQAGIKTKVYVNRVADGNAVKFETDNTSNSIIRYSPNCGKDIGGKMVLIDTFLRKQDESEWIIFMHDKKSLHKSTGTTWREKLQAIVKTTFVEQALTVTSNDESVGMLGPASCQVKWNQNDIDTPGMLSTLDALSEQYQMKKYPFDYVAGTMFWIKADIIRSFFKKNYPLDIRATLEKGNVMDSNGATLTHAWERLFGRIIVANGMKSVFLK